MLLSVLYRDFQHVSFDTQHAAFVIPVAGYAGAAERFIAVRAQSSGQRIHRFPASGRKGKMDESRPRRRFFRIIHSGTVHQFQPASTAECKKIGPEAGNRIMVTVKYNEK